MNVAEIISRLPAAWLLVAAGIALGAFVVLVAVIVWAVVQGREVTFWPPKVGPGVPTSAGAINPSPPTEPEGPFRSFCDGIAGHWWSIRGWEPPSIGFVTIRSYEPTRTVKVVGDIYNLDGEALAHWESQASCINPQDRKVYYYWTGTHTAADKKSIEDYKGFCEMTFRDSAECLVSGESIFSDTNLSDTRGTTFKKTLLKRCVDEDARLMERGDRFLIGPLLQKIQSENL